MATHELRHEQTLQPDRYFKPGECQRLQELMTRWRLARDKGQSLPEEEQNELSALIERELKAAKERAAALEVKKRMMGEVDDANKEFAVGGCKAVSVDQLLKEVQS